MILYSNSVKNVLDRLFVHAVMAGKEPIDYNKCIDAIHSAESGVMRVFTQKPLSWARAKMLVAKTNRYWFSYKIVGGNVVVDEVYDSLTGQIITESLQKALSLIERIEHLHKNKPQA